MVKIAILNLYLHQLERARIELRNPLTSGFGGVYPGKRYDVILASPPFSGRVQEESILSDLNYKLNTRATELLFLKWFIDHLTPGGRGGVIVPNGVLFGSTATTLRKMLLTECDLQAVINLPSGAFKPYSGVGTAAPIFEKGTAISFFAHDRSASFAICDKTPRQRAHDEQWFSRPCSLYPFLRKFFADCGYQGPQFCKAQKKALSHLATEIVKRGEETKS